MHKHRLLMEDREYKEAVGTYEMKSGAGPGPSRGGPLRARLEHAIYGIRTNHTINL